MEVGFPWTCPCQVRTPRCPPSAALYSCAEQDLRLFYLYRYTRMWWLTYTHLEMILSAVGKNYAPTRGSTSGPRGVFSITHSCCLSSVRMLCRFTFAQVSISRPPPAAGWLKTQAVSRTAQTARAARAWALTVLICIAALPHPAATSCGVCFYLSLNVSERPSD